MLRTGCLSSTSTTAATCRPHTPVSKVRRLFTARLILAMTDVGPICYILPQKRLHQGTAWFWVFRMCNVNRLCLLHNITINVLSVTMQHWRVSAWLSAAWYGVRRSSPHSDKLTHSAIGYMWTHWLTIVHKCKCITFHRLRLAFCNLFGGWFVWLVSGLHSADQNDSELIYITDCY